MSARRPWSAVDIELLRRNYADSRTDDLPGITLASDRREPPAAVAVGAQ